MADVLMNVKFVGFSNFLYYCGILPVQLLMFSVIGYNFWTRWMIKSCLYSFNIIKSSLLFCGKASKNAKILRLTFRREESLDVVILLTSEEALINLKQQYYNSILLSLYSINFITLKLHKYPTHIRSETFRTQENC